MYFSAIIIPVLIGKFYLCLVTFSRDAEGSIHRKPCNFLLFDYFCNIAFESKVLAFTLILKIRDIKNIVPLIVFVFDMERKALLMFAFLINGTSINSAYETISLDICQFLFLLTS
jgi:hypothetical protein